MGMIHLIRHAEPQVTGVLLGRKDPPLLTRPSQSALCVRSVFTSPLTRARETAVALFPSAVIKVLPQLVEVSLGDWDGLTWAEIEARDPVFAARKLDDWFGVTPPGGETCAAILSRVTGALAIVRQAPPPVAVVAHVGVNAVLWELLTGSPAVTFKQDYLEVKTFDNAI